VLPGWFSLGLLRWTQLSRRQYSTVRWKLTQFTKRIVGIPRRGVWVRPVGNMSRFIFRIKCHGLLKGSEER